MKTCLGCNEQKPLDEFSKDKSRSDGLRSRCKKCSSASGKKYRAANSEAVKERYHQWRASNSDKANAAAKAWRASNPDKLRARETERYHSDPASAKQRSRDYYEAHAAELRERARQRREMNPEAVAEVQARYRRKYPERHTAHQNNRRARLKSVFIESVDPIKVYERDGWTCKICGGKVVRSDASLDHIKAISIGGEHSYANVQTAHRLCNSRKGAKVMA